MNEQKELSLVPVFSTWDKSWYVYCDQYDKYCDMWLSRRDANDIKIISAIEETFLGRKVVKFGFKVDNDERLYIRMVSKKDFKLKELGD